MEELNIEELIAKIKDADDKVRCAAWLGAGKYGAAAVAPLAEVMATGELEVARAAKRGLWVVVRHVGRPGADKEKQPVVAALCGLLGDEVPVGVRREALWMLSEIGGDEAVQAIADMDNILENKELREDARGAVERIPGQFAVDTLQMGFNAAPEDYKINMAQSLRARGVEVPGYPCQKLVPTKQTEVQPVGR
jgi:HEAT repeat protein